MHLHRYLISESAVVTLAKSKLKPFLALPKDKFTSCLVSGHMCSRSLQEVLSLECQFQSNSRTPVLDTTEILLSKSKFMLHMWVRNQAERTVVVRAQKLRCVDRHLDYASRVCSDLLGVEDSHFAASELFAVRHYGLYTKRISQKNFVPSPSHDFAFPPHDISGRIFNLFSLT